MIADQSTDSILKELEADGAMRAVCLLTHAAQTNKLSEVIQVLWMHEVKIITELQAAASLWPDESLTPSRACTWLHSLTLSLQMVFKRRLSKS